MQIQAKAPQISGVIPALYRLSQYQNLILLFWATGIHYENNADDHANSHYGMNKFSSNNHISQTLKKKEKRQMVDKEQG